MRAIERDSRKYRLAYHCAFALLSGRGFNDAFFGPKAHVTIESYDIRDMDRETLRREKDSFQS